MFFSTSLQEYTAVSTFNQNITQENFEIFHMKTNITSYTNCMELENVPHLRPEHGRQLARFLAPLNRQFLPRDAL